MRPWNERSGRMCGETSATRKSVLKKAREPMRPRRSGSRIPPSEAVAVPEQALLDAGDRRVEDRDRTGGGTCEAKTPPPPRPPLGRNRAHAHVRSKLILQ